MTKREAFDYCSGEFKWMDWRTYRRPEMTKRLWALYYKVLAKNGGVR